MSVHLRETLNRPRMLVGGLEGAGDRRVDVLMPGCHQPMVESHNYRQ
jgi:hypothetical protein